MLRATRDHSDVIIAGTAQALCELRNLANALETSETIDMEGAPSCIRLIHSSKSTSGMFSLHLDARYLTIEGDGESFEKLGDSIINAFGEFLDSEKKFGIPPHIHIDDAWPDMVREANCSVIFQLATSA